jgi:hypothetical protein
MVSPNILVGQQFTPSGISTIPSSTVTNNPFQLDTSAPKTSSTLSTVKTNSIVDALASLTQLVSLVATASTETPLINANNARATAPGIAVPGSINTTTNPLQKSRLDTSLAKVAEDPEGSVLLQKAIAKGYTIEVGNASAAIGGARDAEGGATLCPECQAALDGGGQVNGVTIPGQKKIVVDPNAPNFDKTLVHELVHAASDNDGNSQQEEGIADVIGYRVSSRANGLALPASQAQIFNSKILNYPNLQSNNSIQNTLANLGISAF